MSSAWDILREDFEITERGANPPEHPLSPEYEKILVAHATELHGSSDMRHIKDTLRHFARAIEAAEGEDPKELDRPAARKPGQPPPSPKSRPRTPATAAGAF